MSVNRDSMSAFALQGAKSCAKFAGLATALNVRMDEPVSAECTSAVRSTRRLRADRQPDDSPCPPCYRACTEIRTPSLDSLNATYRARFEFVDPNSHPDWRVPNGQQLMAGSGVFGAGVM
jgi:hypothetical protein